MGVMPDGMFNLCFLANLLTETKKGREADLSSIKEAAWYSPHTGSLEMFNLHNAYLNQFGVFPEKNCVVNWITLVCGGRGGGGGGGGGGGSGVLRRRSGFL